MKKRNLRNKPAAYRLGYDAGFSGPDAVNSHRSIFTKPVNAKLWEEGKAAGEKARKEAQ